MSDTTDIMPELNCVHCGDILRIYPSGNFVMLECPKCGSVTRYTSQDFHMILKLKKENEEREKEREKHYER